MFFLEKISLYRTIACVTLCLAAAVSAADVAPLHFNNIAETAQQNEWDNLMKYKIFGQEGIVFSGQNINIPDETGWFGTATGDFDVSKGNLGHLVGGPVLIGGNMKFADGKETLSTGPVRVLGDVTVGNFNGPNIMHGPQCIQGSVAPKFQDAVDAQNQYFGSNYANCPATVPNVDVNLKIPTLTGSHTYKPAITADNNTQYIDVTQSGTCESEVGICDIYIENITFNNESKLMVTMPSGGRLTRIFLKEGLSLSAHPMIRIRYKKADGTFTYIENKDYSGNLLFYTDKDINWPAINATDSIQGTFISTGSITIEQHMTLAGQLLANNISINSDFDGSGFRYVPFDPPLLNINSELLANGRFPENNEDVEVPIQLDKISKTDVAFKYCFEFDKTGAVGKAFANDFNTQKMPICKADGSSYSTVKIVAGELSPKGTYKVFVNAKIDGLVEPLETFKFDIFDLEGAVMPNDKREGFFTLTVADATYPPITRDSSVSVYEDSVYAFDASNFPYKSGVPEGATPTLLKSIIVTKVPGAGLLKYFGNTVTPNLHIPADSISNLTFIAAPNAFNATAYTTFEFKVEDASDFISTDAHIMTVKVLPVNDAPVAKDAIYTVPENSSAVTATGSISVTDIDDTEFTYEFDKTVNTSFTKANYDKVTELFVLDAVTGKISVKPNVALNYESADSIFTIRIKVSDKSASTGNATDILSDTIVATIKLIDVNEAPNVNDTTFTIAENSPKGTVVGTLNATDPDKVAKFNTLTYSIAINNDNDKTNDVPFTVDSTTGQITVADASKLDFETTPSFEFYVTVSDSEFTDSAKVTVNLTDVNEPPAFVDDGKNHYDVYENSPTGFVFAKLNINDVDAIDASATDFVVTLTGNDNVNKIPTAESLFAVTIVKQNNDLIAAISVKDSALLDYEKVKASYNVTLTLKDQKGIIGCNQDMIIRTINVLDVNEAPTINNATLSVNENSKNGTVVGALTAADPDIKNIKFSTLTYKVISENVPFKMDTNKVVVSDYSKLNYEKDSVFIFDVQVSDGELNDTATVTIKLKDVNEIPEIIPVPDSTKKECDDLIENCKDPSEPPTNCTENCGYQDKTGKIIATIEENSPIGTKVLEYVVRDEDKDDIKNVTVSFTNTNKSGADSLFKISMQKIGDDYKLVLVSKDSIDYEKVKEFHDLIITTKDALGLTDTIVRTVQIIDVNEAPELKTSDFEFPEHLDSGSVVGTIVWGDDWYTKDIDGKVSFRDNAIKVIGGDIALFDIEALQSNDTLRNAEIKSKKEFNFETDSTSYSLIIKIMDRNSPNLFSTETVYLKLVNVPETPYTTTVAFDVDEHVPPKTIIDTLKARDGDCLDTSTCKLKFSLAEKNEYVSVEPSGVIRVADSSKVNFEKIEAIKVKVRVTDEEGLFSDTLVVIKVNDINEPPHIIDQVVTVSEDAKPGTKVDTVKATDPDKTSKFSDLTYTVIGGDSTVFKVDPKTGIVILKDTLDFEAKNKYSLLVEVNDGEFKDTATVTIKVLNVVETSEVKITKMDNIDSTYSYPELVYTNKKDATVTWKQDGKILSMDTTFTKGKNEIVITYKDSTKDLPGSDTLIVMFSDEIPSVTVSANANLVTAENIYTIVENTGNADTNLYVNKRKNDVRVTVKDPTKKRDTSFVVNVDLNPVSVSQKTLDAVNSIAKSGLVLNEIPSSQVTNTTIKENVTKISYKEIVGRDSVIVSYNKNDKGDVIKVPVVNSKGSIDSIEVITVTYNTKSSDGRIISISYQADAATGEILVNGTNGELMVSGASKNSDKGSDKGNSKDSVSSSVASEGLFTVKYDCKDALGNVSEISYAVNEKGTFVKNSEGDMGYSVSYTYVNEYGNAATQSVFIVLDEIGPKVEILSPEKGRVVRANYVSVEWTVDGVKQDSLNLQGLEKGANVIVRFYRDKAGNEASDTVFVVMKDSKDVEIAIEQPVTEITREKVEEYYAANPPKEGQTFAVSIKNPTSGKEVETLIGGDFKAQKGSGEAPYPGVSDSMHLGPTLSLDIRLPVVNAIGGLATMDDLMSSDGMIPLEGIDADNSKKVTVQEYVNEYCEADVDATRDLSKLNLYKSKMKITIWVYTSLGNFVDKFSFTQEMNDPDYTNDAGMLQMFFEMKPDVDGYLRAGNGKKVGTGAYLYKVEASIRSSLRCTLPPVADKSGKKKGNVIKSSDELLKSFGYKRPADK